MSRYIKLDDMRAIFCQSNSLTQAWSGFDKLLSIDIVRCKECMFADVDAEAEMARCSLVSFPLWHRGDYFCADGEREGE